MISSIGMGRPKMWTGMRMRVRDVMAASISRFSLLPSGASSGNFIKVTQRIPVRIALDVFVLKKPFR